MTVYLDEVFLVNLVMDWLILWAVGNFAQCHASNWRLMLAAVLGAGYSVLLLFFPEGELTMLPVKLGWSVLMLRLAYTGSWRSHIKLLSYFYLISFARGGASLGTMYLFRRPVMAAWSGIALVEMDFQLFWLAFGAGFTFLLVYVLRSRLRQDIASVQNIVTARVQFQEKTVTLHLLADTGHSLTDPLTGKSILIAEHRRIIPLFSKNVQKTLEDRKTISPDFLLELAREPDMAGRWRIIPYQAVGQRGLLAGFRPDYVYLRYGEKEQILRDITIALVGQQFSADEAYQGLVPLDLL